MKQKGGGDGGSTYSPARSRNAATSFLAALSSNAPTVGVVEMAEGALLALTADIDNDDDGDEENAVEENDGDAATAVALG